MHRIKPVCLADKVSRCFGRAADAAHLRKHVRLEIQFEDSLDQCGRYRIVTATGAQSRYRTLVVTGRQAECVLRQAGML
jgi:hypothetical protein